MRKNNYAAIYARVSTVAQEYDRQISEIKKRIEQDGFEVKFVFEEKISGRAKERPEFEKLRKLTNDDISRIYVWEISRLSRRAAQILTVVDEFADKGISIYSLKENLHTLDDNGSWDNTAKMVLGLFSSMSQTELETLRERTMSGKKDKIAKGEISYTQRPPYGYDTKGGLLVINPERAEVVRTIFDLFLQGYSPRRLEKQFGKGCGSVHKLLRNVAYTGKRPNTFNPEQTLTLPQIITEETFAKTQKLLEKKRTREPAPLKKDNPLSCKVVCSKCGSHMYKVPSDGTKRYQCRKGCVIIREDCILMNIDTIFSCIFHTRQTGKRKIQIEKDRDTLVRFRAETQKQHDELLRKEANTEKKIRALMDVDIDTSDEQKQLKELRKAIKEKHAQIVGLNNEIGTLTGTLDDWEKYNDWETIKKDPELWGKVVREQVVSITAYKLSHHYKYLITKITGYPSAFGCLFKGKMKKNAMPTNRIVYVTVVNPDKPVVEEEVMKMADPLYRAITPDLMSGRGFIPRLKDYDEDSSSTPDSEELPEDVLKEFIPDTDD